MSGWLVLLLCILSAVGGAAILFGVIVRRFMKEFGRH
jgi:hypothetical protein